MVPLLTEILQSRCVSISALMMKTKLVIQIIAKGLRLISCTCTRIIVTAVAIFGRPLLAILDLTP